MKKERFEKLMNNMNDIAEYVGGNKSAANAKVHIVPDVKAMRNAIGYKQSEFADLIGVSCSLVEAWEQEKRIPQGPSLKLLKLLRKNPETLNDLAAL